MNSGVYELMVYSSSDFKTHHYIIFFVRPLLFKAIIMVDLWCYYQSGVTELLIMRDSHYGRMCFKSDKTLRALHSQLWKRHRPSASAFSTTKNVELLGLYPIRNV